MFRELLRKNQQLSLSECLDLLKNETRGVLSVIGDDGYPYGFPMNHWYNEQDGKIYFHCGKQGHKLDALQQCDKVSFCVFDKGYRKAEEWAWNVKSVIVFGQIKVIDDQKMIADITAKLSRKFTRDEDYILREIRQSAKNTLLLELSIQHLCGKKVKEE